MAYITHRMRPCLTSNEQASVTAVQVASKPINVGNDCASLTNKWELGKYRSYKEYYKDLL